MGTRKAPTGITSEIYNGENNGLNEPQKKDWIANRRAYIELKQAMSKAPTAMGLVEEAINDEHPEGDARKAWELLLKRYEPKTTSRKEGLKEEFEDSTPLYITTNPLEYMDKLRRIKRELKEGFGYDKSDEDILDQTLKVLPRAYDTLIDMLRMDRDKNVNVPIDLDEIGGRLHAKYELLMKRRNRDTDKHRNE